MKLWAVSVCQSVCLSCLDLTRERKGLESQKLAEWKPITRVTCEPIYTSKGQRSRSPGRLMLPQTMHHTQVGVIRIFLKLTCFDLLSFSLTIDESNTAAVNAELTNDRDRTNIYYSSGDHPHITAHFQLTCFEIHPSAVKDRNSSHNSRITPLRT